MHLPKVLFVDWDGTLCTGRFWGHWAETEAANYERVQRALFLSDSTIGAQWLRGCISSEDCMEMIADEVKILASRLLENLIISCKSMTLSDAGVTDLIHRLRAHGMKVVVATDNMDTFSRWTSPSLGLDVLFDDLLNSAEIGWLKQDLAKDGSSRFFQEYLASNKIDPADCALIDDSSGNRVLKSTGMTYFHIKHTSDALQIMERLVGIADGHSGLKK